MVIRSLSASRLAGPRSAFIALLILAACGEVQSPGRAEEPVVYGTDDRQDVYEHRSRLFRGIAEQAIPSLMDDAVLDTSDPDNVLFVAPSLGREENLCASERFFTQPTAGTCSTTLIDVDLILTAGHCVDDPGECEDARFVFGYYYEEADTFPPTTVSDIYRCRQHVAIETADSGLDYGVVQLDRPVSLDRTPATVRAGDEPLAVGTPVTVVGFPSGLPAKIDDGGEVIFDNADDRIFFQATTDTFSSNSGSGVFDASGELVGTLVRGERDYDRRGSCRVVNVLPEESPAGDGEDVTYVARAIEGLCDSGWGSDLCGDTAGWCRPCREDGECPSGFRCAVSDSDPGVTWCAKSCASSAECEVGHECDLDAGECNPTLSHRCRDGNVWDYNSCGRAISLAQTCTTTELCQIDACVPAGDGNACENAIVLEPTDQTLVDDLDERFNRQTVGSCGGEGIDRVFEVTLDRRARWTAEASGFDTVLYIRSECRSRSTEIVCDDDTTPPGDRGTRIEVTLDPGTYYLFLDAYGFSRGSYRLELTFENLEPEDAGVEADAGTTVVDAGNQDGGGPPWELSPAGGGCDCSMGRASGRGPGSLIWLFLLASLALFRHRRA